MCIALSIHLGAASQGRCPLVRRWAAIYHVTMSHLQSAPANPANAPSAGFFGAVGIAPGMRVLDVGCGNGDLGRTVAALAGTGGEVVGIDRSEGALAAAREVPPQSGYAPIRYVSADLGGTLPDLGRFDAIVGRRVLMYLPDAAATFDQLAHAAAPGAVFAFQEHARADLPSGVAELPVHRRCYALAWDTVAAEGGDVTLGYRLPELMQGVGITIEQARSEGVVIHPWQDSFLPTLLRMMMPRMIERGVARAGEVDLDALGVQLDGERRAVTGTIVWDLAFLVAGRLG